MSDGLVAGQKVGPYRVLFRLGKGGMGEVWAASHDQAEFGFQKLVALKVLLDTEKDSNAAVMFFDEAKAASALQHQSIVSTVDLGQDRDIFYLAMEMVRGPSLTALLQRLVINKRKMTPAMVAHVGTNIASALDYAQTRASLEGRQLRLIHRDVSPHNVLLDLNGSVRLTDFGVARTAIQDHKSKVGTVRGKPSYMAPEQVIGGAIDGRTDVFALGVVLYESACLKRLFGRSNPVKSMDAVLKHTPKPLTDLVPDFPVGMWKVLEKALQKKREARWQSAAEFGDALSETMRALEDATTAPMDLVKLIGKNFEADAFDIDTKIEQALLEAGDAPVEEAPRDPTVARPIVQPVDLGTPVVWPTAHAPDPLAPEAIEQARTQFRALTPSAVSQPSMHMHGPSVDVTPLSATGSQSFIMAPGPKKQTFAIPALVLAMTAVVALTVAVVVTNAAGPQEPTTVQLPPPPTAPTPQIDPKVVAKKPPPTRRVSKVTPPPIEPDRRTPARKVTKRRPPPKRATPKPPPTKATAEVATFRQVLNEIRRLEKVDEKTASALRVTLVEVGRNGDPEALAEIQRKARRAMAAAKKAK